ncbi:MAG TPA: M48 family metallopeptidase [Flavisolibacter sp.]|jgi:predicted Zn-dependent protease|nr:M48 family metallopeptidase [Flavisolibacter sp.]
MRYVFAACICLAFLSCNLSWDNDPGTGKKITYSYACVDSAVAGNKTNKTIGKASDILRDLAIKESSITDEVQNEYGKSFHQDAIENKVFVLLKDPAIQARLDKTLKDLLAVREKPSAIQYSIYALDDTAINAFTFGGHIYVTKAMYDRCKNRQALLYAIVGHEIGHSEKGHIKKTIQEMQLADKVFGEEGITIYQLKKLLTASFNQHNELEADYYGTDLSYQLKQDLCAPVSFWEEMARQENEYSKLEDFFRSHPFSSLRAQCLKDHISSNFGVRCP